MKKWIAIGSSLVFSVASAQAGKIPSAQVVDSGSFGVYLNGKRVATETFKVEQRADGSSARSELKSQDGVAQKSDMELTPTGDLVRYTWQELQPVKAELSINPTDEFLTEKVSASAEGKAYTVPHLLALSTPILDDNFFLHREILMWRYLATCTRKPQGLECSAAPQQFGVLVPAQHLSESVTIDYKDKEKISLKGHEMECNTFVMQTDNGDWLLYLDSQQKLVRIVGAGQSLEVDRD